MFSWAVLAVLIVAKLKEWMVPGYCVVAMLHSLGFFVKRYGGTNDLPVWVCI